MIQDIFFNDRYLSEYGCVITAPPSRPFPKRRFEKISIPGRNGDLVLDDECYENIQIKYKVETIPDLYGVKDIDEVLHDLKAWLLTSVEYRKLYDTELPDGFYYAFCSDISNAVKVFENMYEFEITFDCKPFFYLNSGQIEQTFTSRTVSFYNEGNYKSYPKIKIIGTGQVGCQISLNENHFIVSDISPNVIVDCEKKLVYSSSHTDKSDLFSGVFPVFYTGGNIITFSGDGFQSATVMTRWCKL